MGVLHYKKPASNSADTVLNHYFTTEVVYILGSSTECVDNFRRFCREACRINEEKNERSDEIRERVHS